MGLSVAKFADGTVRCFCFSVLYFLKVKQTLFGIHAWLSTDVGVV